MKLILKKPYTKPNGRTIPKGATVNFTNEQAQKLIDSKTARPLNAIDNIKQAIKPKEKAIYTPDDAETANHEKPEHKKTKISNH